MSVNFVCLCLCLSECACTSLSSVCVGSVHEYMYVLTSVYVCALAAHVHVGVCGLCVYVCLSVCVNGLTWV